MKTNLQAYNNYKASGVDWLGDIPEHWEVIRLKNIIRANITDGPHETPVFIDEGIPFLSVDGIQEGELVFENCRYISVKDFIKYKKKCNIEKYDILMGKAASIGKIAQSKVDFEYSIWSPLALIKPLLSKINSTFLEFYLKSSYSQYQIEILCTSNTQKNISMGDIPKIISTLPPLNEQTVIAKFLDDKTAKIDQAIIIKKNQIELLKERKHSLINKAVTKGINPNAKLKASGVEWIGEIPEHWQVKRLKYVFQILKRISGELGHSVLSITQKGIKVKDTESGTGQLSMDYSKYQFVYKGDFAMNHMDLLTGYVDISKYEGVISPDYRVFDLIEPNSSKEYMLLLLQLCYSNKVFYAHGQGVSMLGRWRFPSENFNIFPFPVPPKSEQIEIADFIAKTNKKIATAISLKEKEIEKLKEYKASLINSVVTGKLRVS